MTLKTPDLIQSMADRVKAIETERREVDGRRRDLDSRMREVEAQRQELDTRRKAIESERSELDTEEAAVKAALRELDPQRRGGRRPADRPTNPLVHARKPTEAAEKHLLDTLIESSSL